MGGVVLSSPAAAERERSSKYKVNKYKTKDIKTRSKLQGL